MKTDLSPAYIRRRLSYDPLTGELRWKRRPLHGPQWNAKHAGKLAGCQRASTHGYRIIRIGKAYLRSTHVIWCIMHGRWPHPGMVIDHIDRNRDNQVFANLRECTPAQNNANQSLSKKNTSGVAGVHFIRRVGRWMAYIGTGRDREYLGCAYLTKEAAIAARQEAAERLWGEFAPVH